MIKIGFLWEIESNPMYIVSRDENTIYSVIDKVAQHDIRDTIIENLIVVNEIDVNSLKDYEGRYNFKTENIMNIVESNMY